MAHENTMQPFEKGDVIVACTVLNNPDDDHAGDGRLLQYDADLNEKGVLWIKETTHLVNGLSFAPDGTLWAFDQHIHMALNIDPKTCAVSVVDGLAPRALSSLNFMADGSMIFGEHLCSDANLPGTHANPINDAGAIGEGKIFKYGPDKKTLRGVQARNPGRYGRIPRCYQCHLATRRPHPALRHRNLQRGKALRCGRRQTA